MIRIRLFRQGYYSKSVIVNATNYMAGSGNVWSLFTGEKTYVRIELSSNSTVDERNVVRTYVVLVIWLMWYLYRTYDLWKSVQNIIWFLFLAGWYRHVGQINDIEFILFDICTNITSAPTSQQRLYALWYILHYRYLSLLTTQTAVWWLPGSVNKRNITLKAA